MPPRRSSELLLKLGDPPTPVPEPFASLLRELADDRPHLNTATNPDARWLSTCTCASDELPREGREMTPSGCSPASTRSTLCYRSGEAKWTDEAS